MFGIDVIYTGALGLLSINGEGFPLKAAPSRENNSEDGMEREYSFYGKLIDKDDLEHAENFSDQLQYRVQVPSKEAGREIWVRIRKTIDWQKKADGKQFASDPVYTLTIKSFIKGGEGCSEAESELPAEQGEKLLEAFRKAGDGMIKRRYRFPVTIEHYAETDGKVSVCRPVPQGLVWEVDVPKEHRDPAALSRSEVEDSGCWIKLDLEVKDWAFDVDKDSFPLPFPVRLVDAIYQQPGQRDKVEEVTIRKALAGFKPDGKASTDTPSQEAAEIDVMGSIKLTIAVSAAIWIISKGIDVISKAFKAARNHHRDRDVSDLSKAQSEQEKVLEVVKHTFLNGDWLDRHHMEMRAVSGGGIVGPLSHEGRFPGHAIGAFAAIKQEIAEAKRLAAYLKSKGKAKSEDSYADLSFDKQTFLGNVDWDPAERKLAFTYSNANDTIIPLSKIEVPNAADLVEELLKVYFDLEEIASNPKRQHKLDLEWAVADSLVTTAKALVRWMGRSVKQKDISAESLQPSLEEGFGEASLGEKLKRIFGAATILAVAVGSVVAVFAAVHYISKGIDWLFSDHARKDKATATRVSQLVMSEIDTTIKGVESTYLNPAWMQDAKLETQPISAQGISKRLSYQGHYSASSLRNNVERHIRAVDTVAQYYKTAMAKWATEMNRIAQWIHDEAVKLANGHPNATSDVKFLLENAADRVTRAGEPWLHIPLKVEQLLGTPVVDHDMTYLHLEFNGPESADKEAEKLPPLKSDEVRDAATALVLTFKALRDCSAKFEAVPGVADGEDGNLFNVEVDGSEVWQEMVDQSPLNDVYWHGWRNEAYIGLRYELMQSLMGMAEALTHLLQRSVLKKS